MDLDILVGNQRLRTTIDFARTGSTADTLILHGAGTGNRTRTRYLAREFARRSRSIIRFDFSGHGDSSGKLSASSLQKRLAEALVVAQLLDRSKPITLIGNSMGGHIAARLTRLLPVSHLVLLCPAAYGADAETVQFDNGFKEAISEPGSYQNSPAFADVAAFSGRVTIALGSEDTVIPPQVISLYREAAPHHIFELFDGAPHLLHPWLEDHEEDRARLLRHIFS